MPKEDYIPGCEYDQKHKPALVPAEYTISKFEDSLEKAKEIIHFAMTLEKHPTFINVNICKNGDAYVNLSYDEDENEGE